MRCLFVCTNDAAIARWLFRWGGVAAVLVSVRRTTRVFVQRRGRCKTWCVAWHADFEKVWFFCYFVNCTVSNKYINMCNSILTICWFDHTTYERTSAVLRLGLRQPGEFVIEKIWRLMWVLRRRRAAAHLGRLGRWIAMGRGRWRQGTRWNGRHIGWMIIFLRMVDHNRCDASRGWSWLGRGSWRRGGFTQSLTSHQVLALHGTLLDRRRGCVISQEKLCHNLFDRHHLNRKHYKT